MDLAEQDNAEPLLLELARRSVTICFPVASSWRIQAWSMGGPSVRSSYTLI